MPKASNILNILLLDKLTYIMHEEIFKKIMFTHSKYLINKEKFKNFFLIN